MNKNDEALYQVRLINDLMEEIETTNKKLEGLDKITRHSPKSKIFTKKNRRKVFASCQRGDYEIELRSTDLMLLESALERQRDLLQADLDKELEHINDPYCRMGDRWGNGLKNIPCDLCEEEEVEV